MKNGNLVLTIDDALDVIMRFFRDYTDANIEEELDIRELLYNELEQKCYLSTKNQALKDIISGINPQAIGRTISSGDSLVDWCKAKQACLQIYMMGN